MMYDAAATVGKLLGVVVVFIIFYILLHFGGLEIGLPAVLAIIAANIVEVKVMLMKINENN